jgi:hypothetical protein
VEDGGYGAGEEGTSEEVGACYVWRCFVSGISLFARFGGGGGGGGLLYLEGRE